MPGVVGFSRDELIAAVCDEILGYGPIEPLLQDPSISEVMVNAPDTVYFEKEGRLYLSPIRFRDNQHIMRIIERILAPLGQTRRRVVADGGRPPAGRLPCQHHHPAGCPQEPRR